MLGLELSFSHICHVELGSWEGESREWKRTEAKLQGEIWWKEFLSQTQKQSQRLRGNGVSG